MTAERALAIVLASAVLHAGWNALVAGAKDTHATAAVAMLTGVVVFAIPAALTWRVEAEAWPFIAASAALELAYFALLAATYSRADYSFAYPVARGSAPILVLLISTIALGADISAARRSSASSRSPAGCCSCAASAPRPSTRRACCSRSAWARASRATRSSTTAAWSTPAPIPYFEIVLLLSAIPYALVVGHAAAAQGRRPPLAPRRRGHGRPPTSSCWPRSNARPPRPSPRSGRRASCSPASGEDGGGSRARRSSSRASPRSCSVRRPARA